MAQIDQLVTMTDISEKLKDLHLPEKEKPAEAPSSFVADDDIDEDSSVSSDDSEPVEIEEFEASTKYPASLLKPSLGTKINVHKVKILCNPYSGAKNGEKIGLKAKKLFNKAGVDVDLILLEKAGHAEKLCQTMDLSEFDVLAVVGGDGTIHECVNGIMKRQNGESDAKRVNLAFIPAGTGNSLILELQGHVSIKKAVNHALRGIAIPIDLTELYFPCEQTQQQQVTYSFNSIHWGLGSKVAIVAEKLRWMGNAIRYTTAALYEIFKGEKTFARVITENKDGQIHEYEDEFCVIIANNIVTAAKGMKMAPDAKLNDGLIDLLMVKSSSTVDLISIFRKVYDGTHVDLPYVRYEQVRAFSITPFKKQNHNQIESESDPEVAEELIDVDGELKGLTPFKCRVIQQVIRIIV